jgi:hypothetical protein
MGTKVAAVAVAAALLAGCAAPRRHVMTWAPSGAAAVPKEQALARCSFEVGDDEHNFDRLFLLSGQPRFGPHGLQGLNRQGVQLFEACMLGMGYRSAGTVPLDG